MVSRRNVMIGGAAVAGAIAIPVTKHIRWSGQDYSRANYSPDLPIPPEGEAAWMNWSGLHKSTPQQIAVPANVPELQQIVSEATGTIRPVGSGHSFSSLVPTEGTIVDLSRLNGLLDSNPELNLATFGAGTRLRQAARALNDIGLAFPNLPDIDVQTLAGSFSTATHGTGLELTALHDYIQSFDLVTANGELRTVNPQTDADLFAAGKVSLGALGIITSYTLKLDKAFALRRRVWLEPIDELLARSDQMAKEHRNYEFFYFPSSGYAAVLTHDLHEGPLSGRGEGEDEDMLVTLQELRDVFGWSPWLRKQLFSAAAPQGVVEDSTDESWRLLATPRPTRFNEMEYELPLETGIETLKQVVKYMDSRKDVYFPMETRYIAQDDAWLSPFNDGPRFSISIHAAVDEPMDYFYRDLEPLLKKAGGRPHWGKLHSLGHSDLAAEYPMLNRFSELQRTLDPTGKFLNPHLRQVLQANG